MYLMPLGNLPWDNAYRTVFTSSEQPTVKKILENQKGLTSFDSRQFPFTNEFDLFLQDG